MEHALVANSTIQGFVSYNGPVVSPVDGSTIQDLSALTLQEKLNKGFYPVSKTETGETTDPYQNFARGSVSHSIRAEDVLRTTDYALPALSNLKARLIQRLLGEAQAQYPDVDVIVTELEAALLVDEIRQANLDSSPSAANYPLLDDLVGRIGNVSTFAEAVTFATNFIQNHKSDLSSARRALLDKRKAINAATTERDAIDAYLA